MAGVRGVADALGKWFVFTVIGAAVLFSVYALTAPGSALSRRALAERFPVAHEGVLSAQARGFDLSFRAYVDCPEELPATTQIALEQTGFRSARCTGANGTRVYDLPFPVSGWFYFALGVGAVSFVRARRARASVAEPSSPDPIAGE